LPIRIPRPAATSPTRIAGAVSIVALLLIGGFAALAIQTSYNSDVSTEASKLSSTAAVTSELVAREMRSVEVIDQATVERKSFVTAFGPGVAGQIDAAGLQGVLDQVRALRPEFQFAAVSDAAGATLGVSPANPAVMGKNFSYRDWYRGVTRSAKPYVSSAYVSAVKGAPLVVAVATPVRAMTPSDVAGRGLPSGAVIGTFFIGYKIGSIQAFADHIASVEQVDLELTDQAGVLMAREGGIAGQLIKRAPAPDFNAALQGRTGNSMSATELAASSPVSGIGWVIRATTPLSGTVAVAQRQTTTLIASGLLLVLRAVAGADPGERTPGRRYATPGSRKRASCRQRSPAAGSPRLTYRVHHCLRCGGGADLRQPRHRTPAGVQAQWGRRPRPGG